MKTILCYIDNIDFRIASWLSMFRRKSGKAYTEYTVEGFLRKTFIFLLLVCLKVRVFET